MSEPGDGTVDLRLWVPATGADRSGRSSAQHFPPFSPDGTRLMFFGLRTAGGPGGIVRPAARSGTWEARTDRGSHCPDRQVFLPDGLLLAFAATDGFIRSATGPRESRALVACPA